MLFRAILEIAVCCAAVFLLRVYGIPWLRKFTGRILRTIFHP